MEGPGQFSDFTLDPKARGEVSGRDGMDERRDTGVSEPWVYAEFSHKEEGHQGTPSILLMHFLDLLRVPFHISIILKNILNSN